MLIPLQMHREMLKQLHKAHHGAVRTKQRARLTIYWPGIDSEIDNMVLQCTQCQTHLPSHQKELMISKPRPTRPFQEIAADFCQHAGKYYLVFVDCFTDWPTIVPLGTSTTATDLITASRELFSRTAVPDVFWSDGGLSLPQKVPAVLHRMGMISSPHYPQNNGKAEATVKFMKKVIRSAWNRRFLDEGKALLQYYLLQEMDYHQPRNSLGIPYRTHSLHMPDHSPQNGSTRYKKQKVRQ